MKKILVLIAIFAIFSSFSLKAETTSSWYNKFYVGAGLFFPGKFHTNYNNPLPNQVSFEAHKAKNGLNAFLGYDLFSFLALEVGYNYLLEAKSASGNENYTYTANNFYLNSILKYQFNNHTPFLIFGLGFNNFEVNATWTKGSYEQYKTGLNYILGLGYEYSFFQHHNLGIKYTYNILPNLDTESKSLSGISYINNSENMKYYNIGLYYKYSF